MDCLSACSGPLCTIETRLCHRPLGLEGDRVSLNASTLLQWCNDAKRQCDALRIECTDIGHSIKHTCRKPDTHRHNEELMQILANLFGGTIIFLMGAPIVAGTFIFLVDTMLKRCIAHRNDETELNNKTELNEAAPALSATMMELNDAASQARRSPVAIGIGMDCIQLEDCIEPKLEVLSSM